MSRSVFQFSWHVPTPGYCWLAAREVFNEDGTPCRVPSGRAIPVLVEAASPGQPRKLRHYWPLQKYTGLFRTFAAVPPTPEGVLAFANEHGNLGLYRHFHLTATDAVGPGDFGELLSDWQREIEDMRRAVELWDLLRTNDVSELKRRVRWGGPPPGRPPVVYHTPDGGFAVIADEDAFPDVLSSLQSGDVSQPAVFLLGRWLNEHLERRVSPRMLYDRELSKLVIRFVPEHLCGALWLQFSQAVDGEKSYRPCKNCGKWFEVSLDAARTSQVFCEDRCKSQDYRRRKELALQLRSGGKAVKQIAKELNTDPETVKKWVVKRKG